ncbi:hypothetical protein PGTUg99_026287 [Puccinia graminis f. sp. tritici]|uniref:Uncharacterized protein n=1 Tax=Puccinia graminis f. sp. tritici TaxID=56615 RepID=A0A5B0QRS1_PUCGR|nr:hypothetical protein PGTUg99_026287 [Puccinia graminis f. sp. tritici]
MNYLLATACLLTLIHALQAAPNNPLFQAASPQGGVRARTVPGGLSHVANDPSSQHEVCYPC